MYGNGELVYVNMCTCKVYITDLINLSFPPLGWLPVALKIPIPTTDLRLHWNSVEVETTADWLNLLRTEIHPYLVQEQEGDVETGNVDL